MRAFLVGLAMSVAAWSQVQVYFQENKTIYFRPDTDPAFRSGGIGFPPRGVSPDLWYAYDPLIRQFSREHGVDPVLAKAIIYCESRFQWRATSPKKARGLMQVMDGTMPKGVSNARGLGVYDPIDNLRRGISYLERLQHRYQGNLIKIAAAYNAGEGNVDRYGGIPPFKETRAYVPSVLAMWSRINGG